MKRLGRGAMGISMLGATLVAVLWIWSYSRSIAVGYQAAHRLIVLQWASGTFILGIDDADPAWFGAGVRKRGPFIDSWAAGFRANPGASWMNRAGFEYTEIMGSAAGPSVPVAMTFVTRIFTFPIWFCFVVASTPAFIIAVRLITRRLRKPKDNDPCCAVCGYNLRASPVQCPECGAIVVSPAG